MFLNGAKVGDNFLDPAWSDYDRQVCYQTFDISEELQPGGNVFGVMLGNGLDNVPRERYFKALISFGYPKIDLQGRDRCMPTGRTRLLSATAPGV